MEFEKVIKKQKDKMKEIKLPIKTADEMFEELGFIKTKVGNEYSNEYGITIMFISGKIEIYFTKYVDVFVTSVDLHKAINQKLTELGWI